MNITEKPRGTKPGANRNTTTLSQSLLYQNSVSHVTSKDALYWYKFGFNVIPIDPGKKSTAVKWQPWLDNLSDEAIARHWQKYPDHDVGAVIDDSLFVLDADSEQAVDALYRVEKDYGLTPNLIVNTSRGEHHYFKRAANTHAYMCSFSTKHEPGKIDIRTSRSRTEGRSIVVLPPSGSKSIKINEAKSINNLVEINQDFIDSVFKHNGKNPPRDRPALERSEVVYDNSLKEAEEILTYIRADLGYQNWLIVLMGLHDKFSGSDEALYLADKWSQDSEKYPGFEEIEYKWRSFTINKPGGITFGSVAEMAEKAGADLSEISRRHNNHIKPYDGLLNEAKETNQDTDADTLQNILAAASLLPSIEKGKILNELQKKTGLSKKTLNDGLKEAFEIGQLLLMRSVINEIDPKNIIHANSEIWLWSESGVWKKTEDRTIKQLIQKTVSTKPVKVSKSLVDSVADLFKNETHKPYHQFNIGDKEVVNCLNGQIALVNGKWELQPHKREDYRTTQIPVVYDSNAKAPLFKRFLRDVFIEDDDSADKIRVVLEMMGYSLMAHCQHEKFIMLLGSGANGKSVLLRILEGLCGKENVSGIQPSEFGNSFHRAHLHEKLVNIVTEIKQGAVIEDAALKSIVSGEPATVEHKFKNPFETRPFATCWFSMNHLPHTRDFSNALFRRAIIVPFTHTFTPELGNCDPKLSDKLLEELPGILNMALDAYLSVLDNGFTIPASCVRELKEWRLEADQARQFLEECCVIDGNAYERSSTLFNAYGTWASINGVHIRLKRRALINRIKDLGFKPSKRDDKRVVLGLALDENREKFSDDYDYEELE